MLISPFNEEEFRKAAFSMHLNNKFPGLDGLNAGFYRKFCPICEEKYLKLVAPGSKRVISHLI
jgi:hypothetical protein